MPVPDEKLTQDTGTSLETPGAPDGKGESPDLSPDEARDLESKSVPDSRGERVVPLAALKDERRERQRLSKQVEELTAAQTEAQKIVDQYKQIEPYLPHLAVALQSQRQTPASTSSKQPSNPEIAAVAQELGVDEGTAGKIYRVMRAVAKQESEKTVAPVSRAANTLHASRALEYAYGYKDPKTGRPYASRQAVDNVLGPVFRERPDLATNESVINLLLMVAKANDPEQAEPIFTEGAGGGRMGNEVGMSDFARRAAESRGVSLDAFQKLMQNDNMVLED